MGSDDRDSPAQRLQALMERIVEALDLTGVVEVSEREDELRATVSGEDLGLLIGRHGQTIDAIQHLAVRIVNRGREDPKRVVIDAAGYRDRRERVIIEQAERAAEDAVRFGRDVALDAMTAPERRIVHEYLRDRGGVDTHSEGDEPDRHLIVAPAAS